jgi:putative endonuclease
MDIFPLFQKNQKSLGQKGEDVACKYLKKKGYKILERNFKNKSGRQMGEIDIIAKIGEEIVFVEVKTRELERYGQTLPEENINRDKLHKMNKISSVYIKKNNLWNKAYHFDAISVWLDESGKRAKVRHLENIFY